MECAEANSKRGHLQRVLKPHKLFATPVLKRGRAAPVGRRPRVANGGRGFLRAAREGQQLRDHTALGACSALPAL
eukprot:557281-Alexandrium_andersonii.AAC.1